MIGDAVALVVGESPEAAAAGAAAVRVEYQPLPHTYDAVEAMAQDAVPIYPAGNVLSSREIQHGDLEAALAGADVVLETEYQTPFMEHSALERETVLSYVDDEGRVTIVGGHQQPHWARDGRPRSWACPWSRYGSSPRPWAAPLAAGRTPGRSWPGPWRLTTSGSRCA